jgi:DoxX-like family
VFSIGSGGAAEAVHLKPNVDGIVHVLGYPLYFLTIIGIWKVLGVIVLLVLRFPRLKEWAYAGIFSNVTGAAVSRVGWRLRHLRIPRRGHAQVQATEIIRKLVDKIVRMPVEDEGRKSLSIDLHGHLAGILSLATKASRPLSESGLEAGYMKLVAGTGFEPVTFRL